MIKKITVKGAVQGVGYRPFIAAIATKYCLAGNVKNTGSAVEIYVSGSKEKISDFLSEIKTNSPSGSFIIDITDKDISEDIDFGKEFEIIPSTENLDPNELPVILPDMGICEDCMQEMLSKNDRRYRYPLISCASCGPRISILDKLPYDRCNTTMTDFNMCPDCAAEYKKGRRRHAQTISCHECGPQMILNIPGSCEISGDEAVNKAISLLLDGKILGLKGISGYQLIGLAKKEEAEKIRLIKGRENKPFAVMFNSISQVKEYCRVSSTEEELILSSARPIVLLDYRKKLDYEVVKDSRYIGAFLPSAGIHRLLTEKTGPLIVTSANRSDSCIITDDAEFEDTFLLNGSDDKNVSAMLYHRRRINRPQDDSVIFTVNTKENNTDKESAHFIRRARGYAPLPLILSKKAPTNDRSVLALGGDLKNTFSFGKGKRIVTSPYIGDLKDYSVFASFKRSIPDYEMLCGFEPEIIIGDPHPAYFSKEYAEKLSNKTNKKLIFLQHHKAHIYSVMAEHSLTSCIGAALDGTGFGDDGNIWGCEFFYINGEEAKRYGTMSPVKLTGGDEAPKNASLVKDCYLYEISKKSGFEPESSINPLIKGALDNNINTYKTSGMGRLFDAVSSLLDIKQENSYEGECAISLENIATDSKECADLRFKNKKDSHKDLVIYDQTALFYDIYRLKQENRAEISAIAYGFHMAVCEMIIDNCKCIRDITKESKVCLAGGVFNNRIILRETINRLRAEGFTVYTNEFLPFGDGNISVGQAYYAMLERI